VHPFHAYPLKSITAESSGLLTPLPSDASPPRRDVAVRRRLLPFDRDMTPIGVARANPARNDPSCLAAADKTLGNHEPGDTLGVNESNVPTELLAAEKILLSLAVDEPARSDELVLARL
jgi:hypothetical protein